MTDREKAVVKTRALQMKRLLDQLAPEKTSATIHFFDNGNMAIYVDKKEKNGTRYIMQSDYYEKSERWLDGDIAHNWVLDRMNNDEGGVRGA